MSKKRPADTSRAVVVIPTYNEAATIGGLVDYLYEKTFPSVDGWDMSIVIVDGNSPDGTADVIRKLLPRFPSLHLIVEPEKSGIGAAYFRGFRYAVSALEAHVLIEFDGDFQHPPETIPLLLRKIDEGADLVLGSRAVKGGAYPRQWGLKRLFLSKVGGFVARFILFFPSRSFFKVSDPTTGLKATRVGEAYHNLNFDKFISKSFGYKLEMLFHLVKDGVSISEIPLVFQLRGEGESKIESNTPREILHTVLKLRLSDPATRRFIKFGIVGFMGYLVNALGVEILVRSDITGYLATNFVNSYVPYIHEILSQRSSWAAAFATELAILSNFLLNNVWTFKDRTIEGLSVLKKFLHFNLTSFGAVLLQFFAVGAATLIFGETVLVRQSALIGAIILLVVPYNWFVYNTVIWKNRRKV